MEKVDALQLCEHLQQFNEPISYEITQLKKDGNTLRNFHQWTNGKPIIEAFTISKPGEESYYFLLIDWHRKGNWYLVVYTYNKSTTVCEIQQTVNTSDGKALLWKYNPLKRDGKNEIRKSYFIKLNGSPSMQLDLPTSTHNVKPFLDKVFNLCRSRIQADQSPALFE